tara:strand:- start:1514 stop:1669 length:156 start_codon:yes stop_codon:yes gene_type:complete
MLQKFYKSLPKGLTRTFAVLVGWAVSHADLQKVLNLNKPDNLIKLFSFFLS